MSQSLAPVRSSRPPPSLPRELEARAKIHALREELASVKDLRALGLLEFELGALYEHGLGDNAAAVDCYLRARHYQPALLPALFALARLFAVRGSTRELAELLRTLGSKTDLPADAADAFCEAGLALYDQLGERDQGLALFGEALAVDPRCRLAALLLEQHYRASGNLKQAERHQALHAEMLTDPELKASLLCDLAATRAREGDAAQALAALDKAGELGVCAHAVFWQTECLATRPEHAAQLARAADSLAALCADRARLEGTSRPPERRASGVPAAAAAAPEDARSEAPELEAGHGGAPRARSEKPKSRPPGSGQAGRAAALLREAAQLLPLAEGGARAVVERYERALALRPSDALVMWERLLSHAELGDSQALEADARALLATAADSPLAPSVRVRLSHSLDKAGRAREAEDELRLAAGAEPSSAAATALLEDALLAQGRFDALQAQALARAKRATGPARFERMAQAARIAALEQNDTDAALELLERAQPFAARPAQALRLQYTCAVFGRAPRAAVAAAEALASTELDPAERALLRFDQFRRLKRLGDRPALLAVLRAALGEAPNASWAPHAARIHAASAADARLLSAAHRALAAAVGDDALHAAHLCASARALLRAGDAQAAAEELRLALGRAPDDAYALALLEEALLKSGGEREVARLLRETARSHAGAKQRELALLHAGVAAEAVGDVQTAARSYEEAAAEDPASLGPLWALCRLAERSRDSVLFERALERLSAREAALGTPGIYNLELGELCAARGENAAAVAAFAKVLSQPEVGVSAALGLWLLPEAALELGLRERALLGLTEAFGETAELAFVRDGIAAHLGRSPGTGRPVLEAALSEHPDDPWLALRALALFPEQRAASFQRLSRLSANPEIAAELGLHGARLELLASGEAAAEDALLRGLEAANEAPESLAAAVALDEALGAADDAESRALALFGRLSHAAPKAGRALRAARARALLAAARTREAVDAARRALGEDPNDLCALDLLRAAARPLGEWSSLADAARRLSEHASGRFRSRLLLEAALALEQEPTRQEEAARCFAAALEHDPASELAFSRLHDLLLERRDTDGLLALLDRKLEQCEESARLELCYERALVLRAAGRKQETVAALERVLADDPEHVAALGLLAETCTALEDWPAAVAALRRVARANVPLSQKRLARLGAAEFLERKLGDVAAACDELLALRESGTCDREVLVRSALLCERAGRYRAAVEAYREAAAQAAGASRAELERRAGDVLLGHLGATHEAIAAYERALQAYGLDEPACAHLLELCEPAAREVVLAGFEQALRAAIEREPQRPELIRLYRRLGEWRGRADIELVALNALLGLGLADAQERADGERLAERARTAPARLDAAALAELASALAGSPLSRPAQLLASRVAELERAGAPEPAPDLEASRALPAVQRFELGRRALANQLGVLALLSRTRAGRRDVLRAGLAFAGLSQERAEVEALGKALGKQLARAQRKELTRALEALERPAIQLDAYLDLLELSLERAGLLLCDDLGVALQHAAGGGVELATLAGTPLALELLRFWLSPRLLELRRALGWGP